MSKYKTIEVWNAVFGNKETVTDYAGRVMKKSACGNPNSSYHPTLDHIMPTSWPRKPSTWACEDRCSSR